MDSKIQKKIIERHVKFDVKYINFVKICNDLKSVIEEYNNSLSERIEHKKLSVNSITMKELLLYSKKKYNKNMIIGICFEKDFLFDNYNFDLAINNISYLKIKNKEHFNIFNNFNNYMFFEKINNLVIECDIPCNTEFKFVNLKKIEITTDFSRNNSFLSNKVKIIEFYYLKNKLEENLNKKFSVNKGTKFIFVNIKNKSIFLKLCVNYEEIKNNVYYIRKTNELKTLFETNKKDDKIKITKSFINSPNINDNNLKIINKSKKIEFNIPNMYNRIKSKREINKIKELFCKNNICEKITFKKSLLDLNILNNYLKIFYFVSNKIKTLNLHYVENIRGIKCSENIINSINFITSIETLIIDFSLFSTLKINNLPNSIKKLDINVIFDRCGCGCNFSFTKCPNRIRMIRNRTSKYITNEDKVIVQKMPLNIKKLYLGRNIFNIKIKKFSNNIKKLYLNIKKTYQKNFNLKKSDSKVFILPNNVSKLKITSDEEFKIEDIVNVENTNIKMLFTQNVDISSLKNKHFIKLENKIDNKSKKITEHFDCLFSR